MDINSSHFRDKKISQIIIGYDWESSSHFAQINMISNNETISSFRISRLTEY